jgi:G3E family GTPase
MCCKCLCCRILLNKTDLVTAAELLSVRERISSINAFAEIIETKHSKAPLKQVCFCYMKPSHNHIDMLLVLFEKQGSCSES